MSTIVPVGAEGRAVRVTLAVVYPDGGMWWAQFYDGTEPSGTLAAYPTQAECEDAARAFLRQIGQAPPLLPVQDRATGDAFAATLEETPTLFAQQIGRMLSATLTEEDLAKMVHPHQPVIDLEVAIENVGSEIAKASERYWNESRSPAPDEAVMVEALTYSARLRTLQESLSLDDVEKVQAVLRGEIPRLLEELQPEHMTEIITFVKKELEDKA